MIALFLDDTLVCPDTSQNIKLTRENPYFTQSDSYTLDVVLPMDILENRRFFGQLQRIEVSKQQRKYQARLIVDNRVVLAGTARLTQVTQDEVKVQLVSGLSEVNFLSESENLYIDEMELGYIRLERWTRMNLSEVPDYTIMPWPRTADVFEDLEVRVTPVYDETRDTWGYAPQVSLVSLMEAVIWKCGYTVVSDDIDRVPWNSVYVANASQTIWLAKTLPHWKASEFFREAMAFFNVTIVTDPLARTARIVSNDSFFSRQQPVAVTPAEEYTAEMGGHESDAQALSNVNIAYKLSDSPHHDIDCLEDALRTGAKRTVYGSRNAALEAWSGMDEEVRRTRFFECPQGVYASWLTEPEDTGPYFASDEPVEQFTKMDMFAPLMRSNLAEYSQRELKIAPVAMAHIHLERDGRYPEQWLDMPSMECPKGHPERVAFNGMLKYWGDVLVSDEDNMFTICDAIKEGMEEDSEGDGTESLMQVMFIDDAMPRFCIHFFGLDGETPGAVYACLGFTDPELKKPSGASHESWSLSLNPTGAAYYLGQLHQNPFSFNLDARLTLKFLSDTIPDPTRVYIIRNKQYGCEKIEANVGDGGFDHLMTGYFYEMIS